MSHLTHPTPTRILPDPTMVPLWSLPGGRLVIFDSRRVLHEVPPHTRRDVDRLAVTVWLGGAHSGAGLVRHCLAWWLGWWPAPSAVGD